MGCQASNRVSVSQMNKPTPEQVRAFFDALTPDERKQTGLTLVRKKNMSWDKARRDVIAHVKEHGSFHIQELKNLGIIPTNTDSRTFKRCVVDPVREKVTLHEMKGRLKQNRILYHTPDHDVIPQEQETSKPTVFDKPSRAAAKHAVSTVFNGQVGHLNAQKLLDKKSFPFMNNKAKMRKFVPLLNDEAGKAGWRSGSRPFQYTKGDTQ